MPRRSRQSPEGRDAISKDHGQGASDVRPGSRLDFTVVDLTGASSTQIGEVFDNIDKWAADPPVPAKSRIIILGDDY